MGRYFCALMGLGLILSTCEHLEAAVDSQPAATTSVWHNDYGSACASARANGRLLLIVFDGAGTQPQLENALNSPDIQQKLGNFERLRLPVSNEVVIGGRRMRLISHPAFAHMRGGPGVAVVDYTNRSPSTFGDVVSQFPASSVALDRHKLSVILDLPIATLTQRTLTFAVRIHPENPQSAWGTFSPSLASDAAEHSQLQANMQRQGHHNWNQRFQLISAKLPSGLLAQEVAAESWPGEDLVKGAIECVHSWRRSPGHWNAVRRAQPMFAYDMKQGSNGIWYATGLFGNQTGN